MKVKLSLSSRCFFLSGLFSEQGPLMAIRGRKASFFTHNFREKRKRPWNFFFISLWVESKQFYNREGKSQLCVIYFYRVITECWVFICIVEESSIYTFLLFFPMLGLLCFPLLPLPDRSLFSRRESDDHDCGLLRASSALCVHVQPVIKWFMSEQSESRISKHCNNNRVVHSQVRIKAIMDFSVIV